MAQAVDHDIGSGTATVAGDTAKGTLGGAAVGAGTALLAVAAAIALPIAGVAAVGAVGSAYGFFAGAATAVGLAVGAVVTGVGAAIGAPIGALLGLGGGASRVQNEKAKYNAVVRNQNNNMESAIAQAQQQAYAMGAQDGQAHLINEIQQAHNAQMAHAAAAAKNHVGTPADHAIHAAHVAEEEQAKTAAGKAKYDAVHKAAHDAYRAKQEHDTYASHGVGEQKNASFVDKVGGKKNAITPEAIVQQREAAAQQQHSV